MPVLLIVAPEPLSGKTTLTVGLARRFKDEGRSVALLRLVGDERAEVDARFYAGLAFNERRDAAAAQAGDAASLKADVILVEAPAGDPREAVGAVRGKALVVISYSDPLSADLPSFCQALGDACSGIVITRVPQRRFEATREAVSEIGAPLIGLIPEDRTLAAPTLGAIVEALEAEVSPVPLDGAADNVIDRPVISSIAVDPAQGYFARLNPNAVIIRGDKPDQQLGALYAGVPCLIVTGGLPLLHYVEERAVEDEIPIIRTGADTIEAVLRIEGLFGATPFAGAAKVQRIAELAADLDVSSLA